jgi:molybdate transport system substrate-binding protein
MFARNSICALAPEGLGLTEATIVDKLLDPATRIGISTPKVDPLGDYTVEVYHRVSREHASAADDLMARSTVIGAPAGGPQPRSGDAFADALQDGRVDLEILYCSGRDRFTRLLPTARMIPFPPALQVGPNTRSRCSKMAIPLRPNSPFMCFRPKARPHWHDPDLSPSLCPTAETLVSLVR